MPGANITHFLDVTIEITGAYVPYLTILTVLAALELVKPPEGEAST